MNYSKGACVQLETASRNGTTGTILHDSYTGWVVSHEDLVMVPLIVTPVPATRLFT